MPALSASEFVRSCSSGDTPLPAVIAIAGGEAFLRERALKALLERVEREGYEVERLDADDIEPEALLRRLKSASLFGASSAFLLRSERRGNKQEIVARCKEALTEYVQRPSKQNLLIFDAPTWNGSFAVPRAVKKDHLVVECPEYKPWQSQELDRELDAYARELGVRLERGVASAIREACGGHLALSARELEKLCLVAEAETVTLADVESHLKLRENDHAFALVDAILSGDLARTMTLGSDLFGDDDPGAALQFLGLLDAQLRRQAMLAWHVQAGATGTSAMTKAGMNPRIPNAKQVIDRARGLKPTTIQAQYQHLLDADMQFKSSAGHSGTLLATLCAKLCQEAGARRT